MRVIANEVVDFFDVDGTLVMHEDPSTIPIGEEVRVYDSISRKTLILRANTPMIRLLKESDARGAFVIVWSRGGYQWARDVLVALNLIDHVDQVMSKPMAYFDDTPVASWLLNRVYLPPDTIYKKIP